MARTAQHVIDSVRPSINDADADARSDAVLLGYIVDALNAIKNRRPDLFLGKFRAAYAMETMVLADPLPIDAQFFRPVVDYVIARAEMTDDEYATNGRAELMAKLTEGFLT